MSKRKVNRIVYRLWHNRSSAGRVGYIGKDKYHPTRWNLSYRLKEKACRKLYRALLKYPRKIWRKEILAFGFLSDEAMSKAEIRYIKLFDSKNRGYNLTNGGEGTSGVIYTLERHENMRLAQLGKKHSLKTRRRISRIVKGRKHSAASRARMSLAQMGNTNSKGIKLSFLQKEKIRKRMMGNKYCLGRKHSVETKRKIGDGNRGKRYSKKTREKMSRARKQYYKRLKDAF